MYEQARTMLFWVEVRCVIVSSQYFGVAWAESVGQ